MCFTICILLMLIINRIDFFGESEDIKEESSNITKA